MKDRLKLEKIVAFGVIGIIGVTAVIFILTLILPIDVLRNWSLKTDKDTYSVGDTVTVKSNFDKVMSVTGKSTRYMECKAKEQWVRYSIAEAIADKPVGPGKSEISVVIPDAIPNQDATCRFYFQSDYVIYSYRPFSEEAYSNEFHLSKSDKIVDTTEKQVNITGEKSDSSVYFSVPNTTLQPAPKIHTNDQPPSSSTPQKKPEPLAPVKPVTPPPQPKPTQPSIVQQLLENVFDILFRGGAR
jgi:hypothetical protein